MTYDASSYGVDWSDDKVQIRLFGALIQLLSAFAFAYKSLGTNLHRTSTSSYALFRRVFLLSAFVSSVAFQHHLLKAFNMGFYERSDGRMVDVVKLVDYAITTPLMVKQLALLARLPNDSTWIVIFLMITTIFNGMMGQLARHPDAYAFFCVGVLSASLMAAVLILGAFRLRQNMEVGRSYRYFIPLFVTATIASWTIYPVWYILQQEKAISELNSAYVNLVFDTICKTLLGFVLWSWFSSQATQLKSVSMESLNPMAMLEAGTLSSIERGDEAEKKRSAAWQLESVRGATNKDMIHPMSPAAARYADEDA